MPIPIRNEATKYLESKVPREKKQKTEEIYYFDNHPGEEEDKANCRFCSICVFFLKRPLHCLFDFLLLGGRKICQVRFYLLKLEMMILTASFLSKERIGFFWVTRGHGNFFGARAVQTRVFLFCVWERFVQG